MSLPLISIVLPSYNQAAYIEETLRSILDQNYPCLELLVIDGGSTDGSVDIIKRYESKIQYWVSEKDKGQSDAINKGFAKATGEIITWICSDDLLKPGALQLVADAFKGLPASVGLVHGGVELFDANRTISTVFTTGEPALERYLSGMAFSQPAAFFKREYLLQIGGLVSPDLHFGMDYDLFMRLACVCDFHPLPQVLAAYRLHEASKTTTMQDRFIKDWHVVFRNFLISADWNEEKKILESVSVLERERNEMSLPPVKLINTNLEKVNREKTLFFHLCYQVKALYIQDRFREAKKLLQFLDGFAEPGWLDSEKSIPPIRRNLKYPPFVIKLMQRLKTFWS